MKAKCIARADPLDFGKDLAYIEYYINFRALKQHKKPKRLLFQQPLLANLFPRPLLVARDVIHNLNGWY